MIAYSFFMRESNAWLLILKLAFSVFFRRSYCQQPLFFCTSNSLPSCWYSSVPGNFSPLFLSWWKDSPCYSAMLLRFQKNSLHDYEEYEFSHSYCTLIVSKNLTVVSKGCDSWELWLNFPVVKAFFPGLSWWVEIICPALNVVFEGHQKLLPSTFQCSVQGTFPTNMQNSHFPYLKTVSSTSVWYGEEEVAPSLDKLKESGGL